MRGKSKPFLLKKESYKVNSVDNQKIVETPQYSQAQSCIGRGKTSIFFRFNDLAFQIEIDHQHYGVTSGQNHKKVSFGVC